MSVFAIIFAILVLGLFWGGFLAMLFYSLKIKSQPEPMEEMPVESDAYTISPELLFSKDESRDE